MITASLNVNDLIYDQRRDVFYASVGSAAGAPNGNSIITLDPETLEVLDRKLVGSEPNRLAISSDYSRLYIGIDGATSVRYLDLFSGALGPLQQLGNNQTFSPMPATAGDIVVSPTDPKTIIVAAEFTGARSSVGIIEIFNDSGKVGESSVFLTANSLAFTDSQTLIAYDRSSTFFELRRFSFDGTSLRLNRLRRGVITGGETDIEASGGVVYSSSNQAVDPTSLTVIGGFTPEPLPFFNRARGEVSSIDGLGYFLSLTNLSVFDISTFELLDEEELPIPIVNVAALSYAGLNRLAFINIRGDVGVISRIQFAQSPLPRLNIQGTSGDDWVTFDPMTREVSVNGLITSVLPETLKIHFYGQGGVDHVTVIGDPDQEELAVLQGIEMTVNADSYFFAAHDVAELRFDSTSGSDTAVIFDSDAEEQMTSTPTSVQLLGDGSLLEATNVGTVFVFSSGGDDSARMRGSISSERLNGNMQNRKIRMTGSDFFVSLSGFETVNANGGAGEVDFATIIDSDELDFVFFRSDYGRFLNGTTDYSVRGFERVNFSSASGDDIGIFQKTFDSTVAGNGIWESLTGLEYRNYTFGLNFVQAREP